MYQVPLRVFSCVCFVHDVSPGRDKLSARTVKCVFLGYSRLQKGYKCYSPSTKRHYMSADVHSLRTLCSSPPKMILTLSNRHYQFHILVQQSHHPLKHIIKTYSNLPPLFILKLNCLHLQCLHVKAGHKRWVLQYVKIHLIHVLYPLDSNIGWPIALQKHLIILDDGDKPW
ncbi:hypothetical protein CR513_01264, partial [Mucuna pruriens]